MCLIDVNEGGSRVFVNFYKDSQRVTLGFPKGSRSRKVYVRIDKLEVNYIAYDEAIEYLAFGLQKYMLDPLFETT